MPDRKKLLAPPGEDGPARPVMRRPLGEELAEVPFLVFVCVATWLAAVAVTLHGDHRAFFDMRIYRAADRALLRGQPVYLEHFRDHLSYTYPPFSLLVLSPLALFPLISTEIVWWTLNAVALVAVSYAAIRTVFGSSRWHGALVAIAVSGAGFWLLEPVRSDMAFGQVNVLLIFFVICDLTRGNERLRGLLVGLAAAIKLTPAIYIVYFLVTKNWRAAARAGATFVVASGISWIVLPRDSARYWFHDALVPGRAGRSSYWSNQSWYGMLHRLVPVWHAPEFALWLGIDALTVGIAALCARRKATSGRTLEAVLALALAELLVSPISWTHHWSWVIIAPLVALSAWRDDRPVAVVSVALVSVAIVHPFQWHHQRGLAGALSLNSLALVGAVLLLTLWLSRPDAYEHSVLGGPSGGLAGGPRLGRAGATAPGG